MTPKEKAKDLVSKYIHLAKQTTGANGTIYNAKQCALIEIDEIFKEFFDRFLFSKCRYWNEVKQEIEKL